jgi:recombination protein RecA
MRTLYWTTCLLSITAVSAFTVSRTFSVPETALSARKKAPEDPNMDPAKRAALDGVLNQIERAYGRGSIVKLGDADHMTVDSISSGALTLDAALGGGFPKGRVVEIYGPESSGKTTLALHAIAECQREGGTAAFIDAEHALDPGYGRSLGWKSLMEDYVIH